MFILFLVDYLVILLLISIYFLYLIFFIRKKEDIFFSDFKNKPFSRLSTSVIDRQRKKETKSGTQNSKIRKYKIY